MGDILKGETFVDGQDFTGARANNLVDNAVIQPDFISTKALVTPVTGDHVLVRQATTGLLKRATVGAVSTVGGNVQTIELVMPDDEFDVVGGDTGAVVKTVTWKNVGGNRVFAAPADGSFGQPSIRDVVPRDLQLATTIIAASAIDWDLSNYFTKTLGGVTNFTFANVFDGRTIHVAIAHAGHVCHFPASVRWPGGVEPLPTAATSIFKFVVIGGLQYGWLEAEDCH